MNQSLCWAKERGRCALRATDCRGGNCSLPFFSFSVTISARPAIVGEANRSCTCNSEWKMLRAREITCAGPNVNDRELIRRAEIEIRFHEVVREHGPEQRTCFRRSSIVARPSLPDSLAAVISVWRVVERSLHPIAKRDRAFASDSLTQMISQTCLVGLGHGEMFALCVQAGKDARASRVIQVWVLYRGALWCCR